jgi:hypothetical protein
MILIQLPIEILDNIIQHTLPEGFESVALTYKRIYGESITWIDVMASESDHNYD